MGSIFRSSSSSCLRRAAARLSSGPNPPPLRVPSKRLSSPRAFLRSPLETSSVCLESLLPMHSATASALMKSMLSTSRGSWLCQGGAFLLESDCAIYTGKVMIRVEGQSQKRDFYAFTTVAFMLVDVMLATVYMLTGTLVLLLSNKN